CGHSLLHGACNLRKPVVTDTKCWSIRGQNAKASQRADASRHAPARSSKRAVRKHPFRATVILAFT
ncbi:MAG: hypothetical protein QOI40_3782, partial [Alphaproteobacteria bacterium]|nr:hypothetical protein [Alphaproteobacteria bacterium]